MDATEWSPRKEYMSGGGGGGSYRSQSLVTDNWRKGTRAEAGGMDGDGSSVGGLVQQGQPVGNLEGWRQGQQIRPGERGGNVPSTSEAPPPQRWIQRSTSWRDGDPTIPTSATSTSRGPQQRRVWDEDHNQHHQQLPEWALEQVSEPGGGTPVAGSFDATGAFHGELHKSTSQQNIGGSRDRVGVPLATSRSALSLVKGAGSGQGDTRPGGGNSNTPQSSLRSDVNKEHSPDSSHDKRHSDEGNVKEKNRPITEENILQQQQNIDKGNLINGSVNGVAINKTDSFENRGIDRDDEDFDRIQEDVLKLVVDEEPSSNNGMGMRKAGLGVGVNNAQQPPPPPNLVPPQADKWFYQDPQGDLQGPFVTRDMAEWYRAGYFSVTLLVRRSVDERFFCLGDLVALCQGGNPFQVSPVIQPPLLLRDSRDQIQQHRVEQQRDTPVPVIPVSVNGPMTQGPSAGPAPMLPDHPDLLQLQILQQQIAHRQHTAAQHAQQQQQYSSQPPTVPGIVQTNKRSSIVDTPPAPWASLTALQQRELIAQQMSQQSHQQQHVHQQQAPPNNPLMNMISHMQQQQHVGGKGGLMDQQQVPVQTMPALLQQPPTQPPSQTHNSLEDFIAQMGNLQQQQSTSVSQPPNHLHPTPTNTNEPPHAQSSSSTNPTQSATSLFEFLCMKNQHQVGAPNMPPPQQQQQQQPTTQLEQLALWQKNHQYSSGGGAAMHLQHMQQQQWRAMQQQQVLQPQDQSAGLWDVSTPPSQPVALHPPQSVSVTNQQHPLSHHSSPSPPTSQQQQQQQLPPPLQVQKQPPALSLETSVHVPTSLPQVQQQQQHQQQPQEAVTTPGKKKKAAVTDAVVVEKKKDEEKQRKKEQTKKQDAEKKQSSTVDEKQRKKEEEKIARIKEEKAKQRESDERKAKEHEQKRKAKEQRKIDEENRRKAEEQKRLEDIERERQAARERDEHLRRQQQVLQAAQQSPPPQPKLPSVAPPAPWLLSSSTLTPSSFVMNNTSTSPATNLADIQRAEREKRAAEQQQQIAAAAAAAAAYQQHQQLMQLEREQLESKTFSWASKPLKTGKVKSLSEIQAEEHELFVKKQAEEQRQAALKEKEAGVVPTAGIWSGQSLTWATENMSSNNTGGFWDETPRTQKQQQIGVQQVGNRVQAGTNLQHMTKQLSSTAKALTASNVANVAKKPQQSQTGIRNETSVGKNNNNNNDSTDEFSNWCSKMLANMNANVDVPTFIGFLRDIESAFDVREYCRDYLGESSATQQFAAQFLEKRRLFKPNRSVAHKDDMCAPAPALTPNHHAGGVATLIATVAATSNSAANVSYAGGLRETSGGNSVISMDFQEVKGKGKKVKKSKMLKVDSRILGFSVTAAPDRFNVGDRDYGDTT